MIIIYLDKNSRSFISAEAFILTVIAGSKLRDETINSCCQCPWGQLCMFFAETLVSTTFAREIVGGSASRTLNTAASSTSSLTQITVVETGSTQDTSTTAPSVMWQKHKVLHSFSDEVLLNFRRFLLNCWCCSLQNYEIYVLPCLTI